MISNWSKCTLAVVLCIGVSLEVAAQPAYESLKGHLFQSGDRFSAVVCSPDFAAVEQGQRVDVTVRVWTHPAPDRSLTYLWNTNAGVVHGGSQQILWDLSNLAEGTYQINVKVSSSLGLQGDCTVRVDVVEVDRGLRETGRSLQPHGTSA
jgi:hypothetical protein